MSDVNQVDAYHLDSWIDPGKQVKDDQTQHAKVAYEHQEEAEAPLHLHSSIFGITRVVLPELGDPSEVSLNIANPFKHYKQDESQQFG